jgi:hypothetical protein
MQAMAELPPQRTELAIKFDAVRAMAIGLWECSGERDPSLVRPTEPIGLACALLRRWHPTDCPANPAQFVRGWYEALQERGSLLDTQHGRTSTIPTEEAERAAWLFWGGYVSEGEHVYCTSIEDGLENIPALEALRQEWDVSPATMLRHMKEAEPRLKKRREELRRKYTREEKLARLRRAIELRRGFRGRLHRIFWIDESHLYVVPTGQSVYAPPDACLVIEDERLVSDIMKVIKLRFYCVVNAVFGPVYMKFVTGTTGLKTGFQVGAAAICVNACSACATY